MPTLNKTRSAGSSSIREAGRLASVRHDLRTCLNHIIGYCELIQEDAGVNGGSPVVAAVLEVAPLAAGIVERLNALRAESPALSDLCEGVRTEINAFGERVRSASAQAQTAARQHGADQLAADLAKIHNAAVGMIGLAAHLGPSGVADEPQAAAAFGVPAGADAPAEAESSENRPVEVMPASGRVLVVDDNEGNRDLLERLLRRDGLNVECAASGGEGIEKLRSGSFDLVLLDLIMPGLDGFAVLQEIKRDRQFEHVPIVVLSAVDEFPKVLACIEAGAEDYLTKPLNPVLIRSRARVLLERKRLQDSERQRTAMLEAALAELAEQKKLSEELLANILPASVARELREKGYADPMYFEDATIVLTDFVGFTGATEALSAEELVEVLHNYFTAFDRIVARYGLEKLKTIGDSYMFASGLPERSGSHPVDAVMAAMEMVNQVIQMAGKPVDWKMRVGVHTGPVIAGVVGIRKFAFDVWGESVNVASRMESSGAPNRVNVSERTYVRIKDFFSCEPRGKIKTKEGREVDMYFVNGVVPSLLGDSSVLPPPLFSKRYKVYFQKTLTAFPAHLERSEAVSAAP